MKRRVRTKYNSKISAEWFPKYQEILRIDEFDTALKVLRDQLKDKFDSMDEKDINYKMRLTIELEEVEK